MNGELGPHGDTELLRDVQMAFQRSVESEL